MKPELRPVPAGHSRLAGLPATANHTAPEQPRGAQRPRVEVEMREPELREPNGTPQHLQVFFVEVRVADAKLSIRQLEQAGFELSTDIVSLPDEFLKALRSKTYDVVLSDYGLPGWTSIEALETLQREGQDVPFILVTGTVGEETAVDLMKKGASDFVLKDRPARLPLAIQRALEQRAALEERKRAEALLHLRTTALEAAASGVLITDRNGQIVWVNEAFAALTGYSADEVLGKNPRLLQSGKHGAAFYQNLWMTILAGHVFRSEVVNRRKDGSLYTEEMIITPVRNPQGEMTHLIDIKQDVSDRKRAEAARHTSET